MHNIPLVINTFGWLTGIGLDLILQITQLTKPTLIVQIGEAAIFQDVQKEVIDRWWLDKTDIPSVAEGMKSWIPDIYKLKLSERTEVFKNQ